jgi:hypothetical protein
MQKDRWRLRLQGMKLIMSVKNSPNFSILDIIERFLGHSIKNSWMGLDTLIFFFVKGVVCLSVFMIQSSTVHRDTRLHVLKHSVL